MSRFELLRYQTLKACETPYIDKHINIKKKLFSEILNLLGTKMEKEIQIPDMVDQNLFTRNVSYECYSPEVRNR